MPRACELQPQELRCEYLFNPLAIDDAVPRLTWQVNSKARGARQTAFEILVATSERLLRQNTGDLWDSGKVESNQTVNVVYAGKPLLSREKCYWKVCVWDRNDERTWSKPACWTMGLLLANDWQADYISFRDSSLIGKPSNDLVLPVAHQFRKQFTVAKHIKRATVYATALGIYELYLNGRRVGDARFAPGWTDYHQSAYYNAYDVTTFIKRGDNSLGAWVADGWYSGYLGFGLLTGMGTERGGRYTYGKTPAFMGQLEIECVDGSREIVPTDKTWKVTGEGPVRQADILMGEYFDARKDMPGWAKPGFNDSQWQSAILAPENGSVPATFYECRDPTNPGVNPEIAGYPVDLGFKRPTRLESYPAEPVLSIETIRPIAITSPTNGVYILNMGQNFAGVVRLKVKGPAGTVVRLRYGEQLYADGRLMTDNLRKARATDFYVLRGDKGGEEWTPRFTFHGFQYVEVSDYPGKPGKDDITGVVLQSDTPMTSGFECSDPMANRLFKNVVWTQRANCIDLPTDCPQRDERFGWMGDAQIYVQSATLNADVAAFYSKWLRGVMEAQQPSGAFTDFSPLPFQHGWSFSSAWGDAGVICPWAIWQAYDDTRIIERCWPNMVRFLDWRIATSTNWLGIAHGNNYGDWLSFGPTTPLDYIDTVYFAYSAKLMRDMAAGLGKQNEARNYNRLFENIKASFNNRFVKADGSLTVDTETAYALALYTDLISADLRSKSGAILANKVRNGETENNSGMTTGFLGTKSLLPALTSNGENDVAVKLFQSRQFPSWGYEVEQGATTIWEHWDSYTKADGFGGVDGRQNASMNSFSHYSFGAVCEWMFVDLAGIQSESPGYKTIIIYPHPPSPGSELGQKTINWVNAYYDSVRGRIRSKWKRTRDRFELEIEIPANTSAKVYLPASGADEILEGGQPLAKVDGVRFLDMDKDRAILTVESGSYHFISR